MFLLTLMHSLIGILIQILMLTHLVKLKLLLILTRSLIVILKRILTLIHLMR